MSRRLPARALRCFDGAELTLKLPSGALLLVIAGECEVRVLSGNVRSVELGQGQRSADRRIDEAVATMRRDLARRWTVQQLAKRSGMSRAAFAKAFRAATGETPQARLARERLELATELLRSDSGLAEIAGRVGYATEFAFSRAFKRHFGVAPSRFRRSLPELLAPLCGAA